MLEYSGKICSQKELNLVASLFEQHSKGVPEVEGYQGIDQQWSYGYYYLFLKLTKWDADSKAFFQILQVDQKIGWTNPVHVEEAVFVCKGIQIIQDEEVRRCFFYLGTISCARYRPNLTSDRRV